MGWIESEIADRGGEIPFAEYMQLALYHPLHGYYSSCTPRYGRHGDFLTAPTASPWYARVLAHLLTHLAVRVGPVTVVDLAAGDGLFASELLAALNGQSTTVLSRLVLVEQSRAMRRRAAALVGGDVEVEAGLADARRPFGPVVLHASELFDAIPVDRVVAGQDGLEELWVAVDEAGELAWRRRAARAEVEAYFADHGITLAMGQVAEARRQAAATYRSHLEWAGDNAVDLVLDYGYGAARLYNHRGKAQGSLVCYSRHELARDPLQRPGECDITAHVNWDDLRRSARSAGWCELGCYQLAELLVRAGLATVLQRYGLGEEVEIDSDTYAVRQEVKRLLDPDGMGADLKALIHGQGALAQALAEILSSGAGLPGRS